MDTLTIHLALMLFIISLGMGVTLSLEDFQTAIKQPKAILCGLLSQFIFMPLMAFLFTQIFGFSDELSIGLILVGAAPGGTTSNLFTYWSKGNVALSITMSFISTLAALFMMPLLIFIYIEKAGNFTNDGITLDITTIVLGLVIVVVPVTGGAFLRFKNDQCGCAKCWGPNQDLLCWEWIELIGSTIGGVFLLAALGYGLSSSWELLGQSFSIWFVAIIFEPLGAAFGFVVSKYVMKLDTKECCTIALETGVQNSSLIIAIVALSFPDPGQRDAVLIFPYIYSLCYIFNSAWIVWVLRAIRNAELRTKVKTLAMTLETEGEHKDVETEVKVTV